MKRNICIYDSMDCVIIETDKSKKEIETFCKTYCYQIENDCYTIKPEKIGKLLYDTEINWKSEPPKASEFYNLSDFWND